MIDFLNSFKSLVKVEKIHTDNNVFKLHYKITVIMLIVFSILLTSKQYFGDPIDCDVGPKIDILNTFCWILGTYTLKKTNKYEVLTGLGNDPQGYLRKLGQNIDVSNRMYHVYYQWVCIVFCFQALMFYIPRYLWKSWEGGRLRHLIKDLTEPVLSPVTATVAKDKLLNYLMSGKYAHNVYALRYCVCEILNLINVIGQMFVLDWLLNGNFLDYGIRVLQNEENSLNAVFPKISKCTYFRFGHSGTIENLEALCVLPLNVLNEKLFLILWFWMYILLIVTIVALFYRFIFLASPTARVYLLMGQTRKIGYKKSRMIIKDLTFGDFFILYNVGKNVNCLVYQDLVNGIYDHVRNKQCYKSLAESTRVVDA